MNLKNQFFRGLPILIACMVFLVPATVQASLSGTYTINPAKAASATNYQNFASATGDLTGSSRTDGGPANGHGVSGPVIFNVADGTYKEQVGCNSIQGVSTINTITFQSSSGDSSKVIVNPGNTGSEITWSFSGTNYIHIAKMTIVEGEGYTEAMSILRSNHLRIISCVLTNLDNSNEIIHAPGLDSDLVIQNCYFKTGLYAIYSINNFKTGFINNVTKTPIGLYMYTLDSAYIADNTINSTNYGIDIDGMSRSSIIRNKISGTGCGIQIANALGTASEPCIVANNMISLQNTSDNAAQGIYCIYCGFTGLYFNNVFVYGAQGGAISLNLVGLANTTDTVSFYNNNFTNFCGGYAVSVTSNGAIINANNNNYFTQGKDFGVWDNANYTNLALWSSNNLIDSNSIFVAPGYYSNTDLHADNYKLYHAGKPIAGITTDIDGKTRNASTPDIGANEFSPGQNDVAIGAITNQPIGITCGDTINPTITVYNYGSNALTNVPVYFGFAGTKNLLSGTVPSIPAGGSATYTFHGHLSTLAGGYYSFTAYTALAADVDKHNDTLIAGPFFYEANGTPPMVSDVIICHPGTGFLTATKTPGDILNWYDKGGSFIAQGDTLKGVSLDSGNAAFYVSASRNYYFTAGLKDTSFGNGRYYTQREGIGICAKQNVTLDTLTVYPRKSGTFYLRILGGTPVAKGMSISINPLFPGQGVKIPLNIKINANSCLSLEADSVLTGGLYTNIYNYNRIANTTPLVSVTPAFSYDSALFYFYDLHFSSSNCTSAKVPVNIIYTPIRGIFTADSGFFQGHAGSNADPDVVCSGAKASYSFETGFNDSDYNKTWTITGVNIVSLSKKVIPLQFTMPGPGRQAGFRFISALSQHDSNYVLTVMVKNLLTGCDSVFNRYILAKGAPLSAIGVGDSEVCSGSVISMFANYDATYTYYWFFGDSTGGYYQSTTTHKYSSYKGSFTQDTIKVVVSNRLGCKSIDTGMKVVRIFTLPDAGFTYQKISLNQISYTANDAAKGTQHQWNFGNSTFDTTRIAKATYLDTGDYQVSLLVIDKHGCSDISYQTVRINTSGIDPAMDAFYQIDIFPNPSDGILNIRYVLQKPANVAMSLLDLRGKTVAELMPAQPEAAGKYEQKLSLPTLSPGSYMLQMQVGDALMNRNIVVEK